MKLVGTITDVVQTGMDIWENRRYSKVFEMSSTFKEVEDWARSFKPNLEYPFEIVQFSIILQNKELNET